MFAHRKRDGRPLTLSTQFGCLSPLKTWFEWLARERYVAANPARDLELPAVPLQLPRALLSAGEVDAILHTTDPSSPSGIRNRALLEVLYGSGVRRSEAARLRCGDVDLVGGRVFVREGKGRRDRVVPLGARATAWVDQYLRDSRPVLDADARGGDALFVTDTGSPATPYWVGATVRRRVAAAGSGKPGSCHLFRHACATHMLEGGADVRFIQEMLGHSTLATTARYTHVAIDVLRQVHVASHPANRPAADASKTGRTLAKSAFAPVGPDPTSAGSGRSAGIRKVSITITAELETAARAELKSGAYASFSEVVRAALRTWCEQRAAV